jgi:hypothetical protein
MSSGTFRLGDRAVKRLGYGAMQLAGPGVFGPPKDPDGARAAAAELALSSEAIAALDGIAGAGKRQP